MTHKERAGAQKSIDSLIREALSAEDAHWFDKIDEQPLHDMVFDTLRGKSRWLVWMVFASMFVFMAIAGLSIFRFINAEGTHEIIGWAVAFLFSFITIVMLKTWYWLELNRRAVTREIKRFELQLARLSGRLEERLK